MKGLGRNIKFWIWMLNKTFVSILGSLLLVAVLLTLMEGDWEFFASFIPSYMLMFTFMTVFINALSANVTCFPVSVSLGSARKQNCLGMQIGQHIVALEQVLLLCICNLFFADAPQAVLIKTYPLSFLGIYLLLLGLCTLISTISLKFSKVLGMIIYVLVVVGVVFLAFGVVLTMITTGFKPGSEIMNIIDSPLLLIVGVLVDVSMAFVHFAAVRKVDLKLA